MSIKDDVYKSKNLVFATKGDSRLPTLYFRSQAGCGRIRQQHDSGPKIQDVRMNMIDAFFESKDNLDNFHAAVKSYYKSSGGKLTIQVIHTLMSNYQGKGISFPNAYHAEYSELHKDYAKGESRLFRDRHKSGGRIVTKTDLELIRPQVPQIYARSTIEADEHDNIMPEQAFYQTRARR